MSSRIAHLGLLSLVSSALAYPFKPSGYKPNGTGSPYGFGNETGIFAPSGTAASTGLYHHQHHHHHHSKSAGSASSTTTEIQYVTVTPVPATGSAAAVEAAVASSSPCDSSTVVTVTSTNRVTVTVYPTEEVSSSAASSSTVLAAALISSFPEDHYRHSSYAGFSHSSEAATSSSTTLAAVETSSSAAGSYAASSAAASSSAAPTSSAAPSSAAPTTTQEASSSAAATSSAAASASSTGGSSSSGTGKRGLSYNDASLTTCFESSKQISWAYNWGSSSSGLSDNFEYIPMLWGLGSDRTSSWIDTATSLINGGTKHFFSFNEPDLSSQANLSPSAAATGYQTFMNPLKTIDNSIQLGAPAVTNGGTGMGLDWLSQFMTACTSCDIDFVSIHWYDSASNIQYFKDHVTQAHTQTGKPVWVTEFGCTDGTDDEISAFMEEVLPWMDAQDFVQRYAYFMASEGILVSGGEPSAIGSTYADAS